MSATAPSRRCRVHRRSRSRRRSVDDEADGSAHSAKSSWPSRRVVDERVAARRSSSKLGPAFGSARRQPSIGRDAICSCAQSSLPTTGRDRRDQRVRSAARTGGRMPTQGSASLYCIPAATDWPQSRRASAAAASPIAIVGRDHDLLGGSAGDRHRRGRYQVGDPIADGRAERHRPARSTATVRGSKHQRRSAVAVEFAPRRSRSGRTKAVCLDRGPVRAPAWMFLATSSTWRFGRSSSMDDSGASAQLARSSRRLGQ